MNSRFNSDIRIANQSTQLLVESVVDKALALTAISMDYLNYPDEQFLGKDLVVADVQGRPSMDVKFAATYAGPGRTGKGLLTFAQEFSYLNRYGNARIGWLVDNTKQTDWYCYGWIPSVSDKVALNNRGYCSIKTMRDARLVQLAFVKRSALLARIRCDLSISIASLAGGTTDDICAWLVEQARQIRQSSNRATLDGLNRQLPKNGGYRFTYSTGLQEKPVNLLVYKSLLKETAACWLEIAIQEAGGATDYSWKLLGYDPDTPLPCGITQAPYKALFKCKREWTYVDERLQSITSTRSFF